MERIYIVCYPINALYVSFLDRKVSMYKTRIYKTSPEPYYAPMQEVMETGINRICSELGRKISDLLPLDSYPIDLTPEMLSRPGASSWWSLPDSLPVCRLCWTYKGDSDAKHLFVCKKCKEEKEAPQASGIR